MEQTLLSEINYYQNELAKLTSWLTEQRNVNPNSPHIPFFINCINKYSYILADKEELLRGIVNEVLYVDIN